MKESTLRRRLLADLKQRSVLAIPVENTVHNGMPDMIVATNPDDVMFIELKVKSPKLRAEQYIWFLKTNGQVKSFVVCQRTRDEFDVYVYPFKIKRHVTGHVTITSEPHITLNYQQLLSL